MRQAGLKPKNHSSGVYWVRAASGKGKAESKESEDLGIIGALFFILFLPFVLLLILFDRMFIK